MKKSPLILPCAICALILFAFACTTNQPNKKLEGKWTSKDGETKLVITDKKFTTDDGQPVTEDYFVNKDTIYTSYEGSRPYTKFAIKVLDEHKLTLLYPDSDVVEFAR